jgi:hypothetical protein
VRRVVAADAVDAPHREHVARAGDRDERRRHGEWSADLPCRGPDAR